jgi:S-ribosylhomocysteine lyase LuxS involved in autoinducer biosynthesis
VFKKLTLRQQLEKVEEKQLCKPCFRHLGKIPNCHIKGCGGEHNHLLHDALVLGRALVIQEVGIDSGQSY